MTGTIRERSPGHFELRAYNAVTGKQVTKTYAHPPKVKGVGIAEAKKQLARLVSDIAEGKYGTKVDPAEKVTLSMLLDEWIAHGETRGRSPNTLHGYRSKAARIKAGPLGRVEVANPSNPVRIKAHDARPGPLVRRAAGRRDDLRHPDASPSSRSWRTKPGEEVEVHPPKPCRRCPTQQRRSDRNARADGGTSAGTRRTGSRTLSPDLGLILLFAMLTGMRRGELCGIQWSDIDWVGSRLTVRRSVWQIRSTWGLKDPKTHQVRTIALDPVTMSILTVHKAKAESEAAIACVPLSSDAFVWSTQADGLCPRTRTVSREHFTASVARWKPKRLPLIPHEWSHGTSASMIFVT